VDLGRKFTTYNVCADYLFTLVEGRHYGASFVIDFLSEARKIRIDKAAVTLKWVASADNYITESAKIVNSLDLHTKTLPDGYRNVITSELVVAITVYPERSLFTSKFNTL